MSQSPVILIIGKTGQVGWELCRSLSVYGSVAAVGRQDMDLSDNESIAGIIQALRPAIIVNAAAYTAVDDAENSETMARQINAVAPGVMAAEAKKINALLIHYSTDYVFDGSDAAPYTEEMTTAPLNVYGLTKREGEQAIEKSGVRYLIFRASWVYGARGKNFLLTMLRLMAERESLSVVDDQFGVPTSSRMIAEVTAACIAQYLAENDKAAFSSGLFHLSARGETSWYLYAKAIAENLELIDGYQGYAIQHIKPVGSDQYPSVAKRPQYSTLDVDAIENRFGLQMPCWQDGVKQCMEDIVGTGVRY